LNGLSEHLAAERGLQLLDVEICVLPLPARRLVAAVRKTFLSLQKIGNHTFLDHIYIDKENFLV
jgi:hypothetical protein